MDLIISVDEARKILGNDAEKYSDEDIEKIILDLDAMAGCDLKEAMRLREQAASDLARLIYDIYCEKNLNSSSE